MGRVSKSTKEAADMQDPEVSEVLDKILSSRYGGCFGPNIINPGERPHERIFNQAVVDRMVDL
jgi:hypothetical protein